MSQNHFIIVEFKTKANNYYSKIQIMDIFLMSLNMLLKVNFVIASYITLV